MTPTRAQAICCDVWAGKNTERLSQVDNRGVHANERKNFRPHSPANLDLPANGVENRADINFENGSSDIVASSVGGHRGRTAQNNVDGKSAARAVDRPIAAWPPRTRRATASD